MKEGEASVECCGWEMSCALSALCSPAAVQPQAVTAAVT